MADRAKTAKVQEGLADYKTVPDRIREFKEKFPEGRLTSEFEYVRDFGGADWVVCHATAYKGPDDEHPARASAWERVPGLTPYTKNSEHQNAETSAWGRVLVANLVVDSKDVSSAEEQASREAERDPAAIKAALDEGKAAKSLDDAREAYRRARALGATRDQLDELANMFAQISAGEPKKVDA